VPRKKPAQAELGRGTLVTELECARLRHPPQDLSNLDFSRFKPVRFEFERKDEQINMRVPKPLLADVKARAKARDIPYTRFIRETLEPAVTDRSSRSRLDRESKSPPCRRKRDKDGAPPGSQDE
jgi:predicted DNA binding CopG/RHH family protein